MIYLYIISLIINIYLWVSYRYAIDSYGNKIKIKRILIILSIVAFFIPVINLIYAIINGLVYIARYVTNYWKIEVTDNTLLDRIVSWMNKSIQI